MKLSKFKLSIHKWTQRKPLQMGEDESGDLKTPLKTKDLYQLYTMGLKDPDP